MMEGIKLPNKKIRALGEKEMYQILGDNGSRHKQRWMKKLKKNTPGERGNYSKPNFIAEFY